MTFKLGDVVQLRSGGHQMTISEITDDNVVCVWSDGKVIRERAFNPILLEEGGERLPTLILQVRSPETPPDQPL